MKEEAVGVHMGIAASMAIIVGPALFLSEKGDVFVRRKSEYVSYCCTKTYNYHQQFMSTDDPTTLSLHIVTDISPSLKAQTLVFTTCSAGSSYFLASHLGALHICFLMKAEGQLRKA